MGCNFQYTPALEENSNTLPRDGMNWKIRLKIPLSPRDCLRAISRASGCKLPQLAYFPIHPSSRQCIITILSWVERYIGNYTPNGWVVLAVLLDRLPLWKKNDRSFEKSDGKSAYFFIDTGHNSFEQGWLFKDDVSKRWFSFNQHSSYLEKRLCVFMCIFNP